MEAKAKERDGIDVVAGWHALVDVDRIAFLSQCPTGWWPGLSAAVSRASVSCWESTASLGSGPVPRDPCRAVLLLAAVVLTVSAACRF